VRAAALALTVLAVVTTVGCTASSDTEAVSGVRPADSDVLPRPDWACARRNTFRPVAPPVDGAMGDLPEIHSEATADAFAEAHLDDTDTGVMVITVEQAEDEATYAYTREGETVEELVVTRQDDGRWVEAESTACT
jgi:hypothetical protein